MKKYILIKEYPGSPILGTTIDHHYSNYKYGFCVYLLEKNPHLEEFWEEIGENDYEILSFKWGNGTITKLDSQLKDTYCQEDSRRPFFFLDELLNRSKASIHSVKRISDGEIFTLGDKVDTMGLKIPITAFRVENDKLYTMGELPHRGSAFSNYKVSDLKKAKQPLFVTEDGVDTFQGDTFVSVNVSTGGDENYTIREYECETMYMNSSKDIGQEQAKDNGVLWFSNKEAAEQFIFLNKPCLSLNDLITLNGELREGHRFNDSYLDNIKSLNQLKELVKTKIKNN